MTEVKYDWIGFCGPAYSGKSTAARMLMGMMTGADLPAVVIPFGAAVKDIAVQMGWDGEKDERGRRLLQTLGTECGRGYDPDLWVKKWRESAEWSWRQLEVETLVVIADDVRFENEGRYILEQFDGRGILFKMMRKDSGLIGALGLHPSEDLEWMDTIKYTTIDNNGTLEDLGREVEAIFGNLIQ